MLFNSILIHIDTHNDNQYVTETEDTAAVAMDNGQWTVIRQITG
jgi:hypothetical protein